MGARIRTAILISGRGSNMEALLKSAQVSDYPAEIALVISNVPNAGGISLAQRYGVQTEIVDHTQFSSRAAFDKKLHQTLIQAHIGLVCCAGFMRILTPEFVKHWQGRILNIHPSLLPNYKGLNTHARVLEAGEDEHGCTVHHLTPELDAGPIIRQASLKIVAGDTAESLAARVNTLELKVYPKALRDVAHHMLKTDT